MQRSRARTRKQSMRGGDASNWVTSNFGNGNDQWNNTFANRSGVGSLSNLLPTVPGAPAVLAGNIPQGTLSLKNIPFMSGGRRRKMYRGGSTMAHPESSAVIGGRRARRKMYNRGGTTTTTTTAPAIPPSPSLFQMINGGRRTRRARRRSQKGGFWGQMLAQAAVPLTLLGLQQSFKRKRR